MLYEVITVDGAVGGDHRWVVAGRGEVVAVLAEVLGLDSFLVPSPAEIASSLWEDRSLLAENAWVTFAEGS